MVPGGVGISLARAIYADSAINQLPGDRTSSVVIEKALYAFDLHLGGEHHPGST